MITMQHAIPCYVNDSVEVTGGSLSVEYGMSSGHVKFMAALNSPMVRRGVVL